MAASPTTGCNGLRSDRVRAVDVRKVDFGIGNWDGNGQSVLKGRQIGRACLCHFLCLLLGEIGDKAIQHLFELKLARLRI